MANAEKVLVKVGTFAAGVILAGYVMYMFSDVKVIGDAKKGFGA